MKGEKRRGGEETGKKVRKEGRMEGKKQRGIEGNR